MSLSKLRRISSIFALSVLILFFAPPHAFTGETVFSNASFEQDADSNGVPDEWIPSRDPLYDTSGLHAHSGSSSIKCSSTHSFGQTINVIGGAHYTFSVWAKGVSNWDEAAIDILWKNDTVIEGFSSARTFLVTPGYQRYFASARAPLKANLAQVFPRSGWLDTWVWLDDCTAYNEFIDDGGFENLSDSTLSSWHLVGSPPWECSGPYTHSGSCALLIDRDNYAFQDFAVAPAGKHYLLSLWIRAEADLEINTAFSVAWYDADAQYLSSQDLPFVTNDHYLQSIFSLNPPERAVLGRLELRPEDSHAIWVDDVELLWHAVAPQRFSPNADGIQEKTTILYSVNQPSSVTLVIQRPLSNYQVILENELSKNRSVNEVEWDALDQQGDAAPDGFYFYTIRVSNNASGELLLHGEVEVNTELRYPQPVNQFASFFPRGIWITASGNFIDVDYDVLFQELKEDNFNATILLAIPESRYLDALTAGENHGIFCILQSSVLTELIYQYLPFQVLPEPVVHRYVHYLTEQYGAYTSLLGYYVSDAPGQGVLDNVRLTNASFNLLDPAHPAFNGVTSNAEETFTHIAPAVFLYYDYPRKVAGRTRPQAFDSFCQTLDSVSRQAESKKLPLWVIIQAFAYGEMTFWAPGWLPALSTGDPLSPEEMRCMTYLALAYGARGLFYFMYQSGHFIIGLRYHDLTPTPNYLALIRLLDEIASFEALVLEWSRVEPFASSSNDDCLVHSFIDTVGNRYLVVVNKDCINPAFTTIAVDLPLLTHITNVHNGIPIPFYKTNALSIFDLELMPGDGRIIALE